MENKTETTFRTVCEQITELHERKNKDYGNAFADNMKAFDEFGIISAASAIANKANRIKQQAKEEARGKAPNFEGLNDSLLDCAAYCIMTYVERMNNGK